MSPAQLLSPDDQVVEDTIRLSDILLARKRLGGFVVETPLRKSTWLSTLTGADVNLKLENLQVTGSFKYRGALNALSWAKEEDIAKIFTASAGNHGLGIAEASIHTHREVTVCIPTTASTEKRQRLQTYSVGLIQHGEDCEITEAFARRIANEKKGFYVSPYNNKEVIAGQGTVALEMIEAMPDLSTIVVAVGGGGLIGGTSIVAKSINPKIKVIGVVAAHAPAMTTSLNAGRIVPSRQEKTIADGLAGNIEAGSITFQLAKELVDDWITVDEEEIVSTVFEFLDNERMLIEGAAAAAVAAVSKKHIHFGAREKVGIVVCGGNISRHEWREILVDHLVGAKIS